MGSDVNYVVIKRFDSDELSIEVNKWIKKGWHLNGGISITPVLVDSTGSVASTGTPALLHAQAISRNG